MSDALERARLYLEADEWRKANAVPLCYCDDSILTYPCFLIKGLVTECEGLHAECERLMRETLALAEQADVEGQEMMFEETG